jgi:hypothetical protein
MKKNKFEALLFLLPNLVVGFKFSKIVINAKKWCPISPNVKITAFIK